MHLYSSSKIKKKSELDVISEGQIDFLQNSFSQHSHRRLIKSIRHIKLIATS